MGSTGWCGGRRASGSWSGRREPASRSCWPNWPKAFATISTWRCSRAPGSAPGGRLWQSILAEIGEPYRGIDEAELRIGLVERVRGLAATGSGLVVLVDEAHTLPTRLLEELRLLTNLPTPLPAVHILLVGTAELEEILAAPRMESLSQRIGGRFYLEPLDHAETTAYVRTQMKAAGLDWDAAFEAGCDDAVFSGFRRRASDRQPDLRPGGSYSWSRMAVSG